MRLSHALILASSTTTSALQLPALSPFLSALPPALLDYLPQTLQNSTAQQQVQQENHEILKRQNSNSNTCPTGFNSCSNLGAPGLCCASAAVCSADYAGHVACCPSGAACTGTIGSVITAGTMNSNGALVGGAAATATGSSSGLLAGSAPASTTTSFEAASSTSGNGLVMATTQTTGTDSGSSPSGGGFIIDGSSTVATPGAAVRGAHTPLIARGILRVLEYLPL